MKLSELSKLYGTDEHLWYEEMAKTLSEGRRIDRKNLCDYLLESASRNHREVDRRLTILLMHLLKYTYQPRKRTRSWRLTINHQRYELHQIFAFSASLKHHAIETLHDAYKRARKYASLETGMSISKFPTTLSATLDEIVESEDYKL